MTANPLNVRAREGQADTTYQPADTLPYGQT